MNDNAPDNPHPMPDNLNDLLGPSDEFAAEHARLEAAIATANARTAAARHRIASSEATTRASLRDEVLATQATLAEMDREHQAALAALRISNNAEIERITGRRTDTGAR